MRHEWWWLWWWWWSTLGEYLFENVSQRRAWHWAAVITRVNNTSEDLIVNWLFNQRRSSSSISRWLIASQSASIVSYFGMETTRRLAQLARVALRTHYTGYHDNPLLNSSHALGSQPVFAHGYFCKIWLQSRIWIF